MHVHPQMGWAIIIPTVLFVWPLPGLLRKLKYSTLDAQLRPLSSLKGSASASYQEISTNWRLD